MTKLKDKSEVFGDLTRRTRGQGSGRGLLLMPDSSKIYFLDHGSWMFSTLIGFVSWLTQSDQSDFSIGGVYFSYTPPRRCIFFAWGLDLLRIMGPWYKSVTSLAARKFHPSKTPILT